MNGESGWVYKIKYWALEDPARKWSMAWCLTVDDWACQELNHSSADPQILYRMWRLWRRTKQSIVSNAADKEFKAENFTTVEGRYYVCGYFNESTLGTV